MSVLVLVVALGPLSGCFGPIAAVRPAAYPAAYSYFISPLACVSHEPTHASHERLIHLGGEWFAAREIEVKR